MLLLNSNLMYDFDLYLRLLWNIRGIRMQIKILNFEVFKFQIKVIQKILTLHKIQEFFQSKNIKVKKQNNLSLFFCLFFYERANCHVDITILFSRKLINYGKTINK